MGESSGALYTFIVYALIVFLLAFLSKRRGRDSQRNDFAGEYFLGRRSFGVWAFALTFAATNASGGTFIGFPSLVYSHGWTLALWVAAFMVMPLVGMALIGKRLSQIARHCDALTIPEVFRRRFESPKVGFVAASLLIFFMFFFLVAQFKAGGKILSALLRDEPVFQSVVSLMARATDRVPWVNRADPDYLVCLSVFAVAVIAYVAYGGFRAVVWTDVMQAIVMFVGVVVMLGLAIYQVGGLENATRQMAKMTPPLRSLAVVSLDASAPEDTEFLKGTWIKHEDRVYRLAQSVVIRKGETSGKPVSVLRITTPFEIEKISNEFAPTRLKVEVTESASYQYGAGREGTYVKNPGPSESNGLGFLAIGTAVSFFVFWPFATAGHPSNMVRLMSFKDSKTLRYSIVTVAVYFSVIYFSLVLIFCCARVLMPGMEIDPDRAMPDFAAQLTSNVGVPWLAGLLVAAPFAAVMSSVDGFLLVVSSAVVRDLYQGHINRHASQEKVRRLSYQATVVVGILALLAAINPPRYLQDLIVFAVGGMAGSFFVPMLLCLYWRRMTSWSAMAGMIFGALTHVALTGWGFYENRQFQPYELLGLNPFLWDLLGSAIACGVFATVGPRPKHRLAKRFFGN